MSEVVRFPPLPPVPIPPSGPLDERQNTFRRIIGNITGELFQQDGEVGVVSMVTGYRASAVDVGQLQQMIDDAISTWTMDMVRDRWKADLFEWLHQLLRGWVQRCKHMQFDIEGKGIGIHLETQDDRGYYNYDFDAFPGRQRSKS